MKIIDILNKIANGEEVPKKIIFRGRKYEYSERIMNLFNYKNIDNDKYLSELYHIENILNDEVEIIEERPEPIEELKLVSFEEFKTMTPGERYRVTIAEYDRINKLIKAVNYLLEKDNNG